MTRAVFLAVLLVPALLAGCAKDEGGNAVPSDPPTTFTCGTGRFVAGFDALGEPVCRDAGGARQLTCSTGQAIVGFDENGDPFCGEVGSGQAGEVEHAPPAYASSSLKVVAVYGVRNDTVSDLTTLKYVVELAAGSAPVDIGLAIVRVSDGVDAANYGVSYRPFEATWIRGSGDDAIMVAGDLVELQLTTFAFAPHGIPPRTSVQSTIVPASGPAVAADFKTPPTYGADTVITLR